MAWLIKRVGRAEWLKTRDLDDPVRGCFVSDRALATIFDNISKARAFRDAHEHDASDARLVVVRERS